jgi:hypothetical protein
MSDIDSLFKNARDIKLNENLLDLDKMRELVLIRPNRLFNNRSKFIIATSLLILGIFTALKFINTPESLMTLTNNSYQSIDKNNVISNHTDVVRTVRPVESNQISQDTIKKDDKKSLDQTKKDENNTPFKDFKAHSFKVYTDFAISPVESNQSFDNGTTGSNPTSNRTKLNRNIKPYELIQGLNYIELTLDEFQKLVPFEISGDQEIHIMDERIITDTATFSSLKLDKIGFTKNDLPFIVGKKEKFIGTSYLGADYINLSKSISNYSRTSFIAYQLFENNTFESVFSIGLSPILINSKDSLYSKFCRLYSSIGASFKQANNTDEKQTLNKEFIRVKNDLLSKFIPVKLKFNDQSYFIFWFDPNEEFLSKLPIEIADNLREELLIRDRIQSGKMPYYEACKSFIDEVSYLNLCKVESGGISTAEYYYEPNQGKLVIEIKSDGQRQLSLGIYNIEGRLMEICDNNINVFQGITKLDIPVKSVSRGVFFVSLRSDESEVLTFRIYIP